MEYFILIWILIGWISSGIAMLSAIDDDASFVDLILIWFLIFFNGAIVGPIGILILLWSIYFDRKTSLKKRQ